MAVRANGSVVCWGDNRFGQCTVPPGLGPVAAVAAGDGHSLALLRDGRVVGWGNNEDGQAVPPAGLTGVVSLDAGYNRSLAMLVDGSVVVWGEGADALNLELAAFPDRLAVSAGGYHVVALKRAVDSDGDGLDDALELRIGTDGSLRDTDGDLLEDGVEYLSFFDPLSPTEAVDGTVTEAYATRLRFFTLPDGQYRLFGSTDLVNWFRIGSTIRSRRGYSEVLLSAPESGLFYRLTRLP
jgi:hypothetical protein